MIRVSYEEKLSVRCPACGAGVGHPCLNRRFSNRWQGMPTIKEPHDERRLAWLDTYTATGNPTTHHRYYYRLRVTSDKNEPPPGHIHHELFSSARAVPEFGSVKVFGVVEYPWPLLAYDVWIYDLIPADAAERGLQTFMAWGGGDVDNVRSKVDEYLEKGEGTLKEMTGDRLARAALPIAQSSEGLRELLRSPFD